MTPDELQALAARLEAEHSNVGALLVAEVKRARSAELAALNRALEAEALVTERPLVWEDRYQRQRHEIQRLAEERDRWRLRWARAQEQVGRWFGLALDGRS